VCWEKSDFFEYIVVQEEAHGILDPLSLSFHLVAIL